MKKIFLLPLLLSSAFSFSSMAEGIRYLDPNEIDDLDYCSKRLQGLSYSEVNKLPNSSILLDRDGDLSGKLMHNFIADMYYYRTYIINGSIITSGTLRYSENAKITNSVISNMTFVGDISTIDFTGSCLVNVRFPKETSWGTKRRIKKQALFYKNLEYKHENEPWD